jgi:hypothetical protein
MESMIRRSQDGVVFPAHDGGCEMRNNAKQPRAGARQPKPQPLMQPLAKKQETVALNAKRQKGASGAKKQEV